MSKSASAQLELVRSPLQGDLFGPSDKARASYAARLEVMRQIVNRRGLKETAFDLDASASQVADALAERDRKRVAAQWEDMLILHATDVEFEEFVAPLFELRGFRLIETERGYEATPIVAVNPADEVERLRAELREVLAPAEAEKRIKRAKGVR